MSDKEKKLEGDSPVFPHGLFILTEDGKYRYLNKEMLAQAPTWVFKEHPATDEWLNELKKDGVIFAIHPEPQVTAYAGFAEAIICMMLNYGAVSKVVDKVAEGAFESGKEAARKEASESSKS